MNSTPTTGGWNEYQRLVLAELERHNILLKGIDDRISNLKLEIVLLKQTKEQLESMRADISKNSTRLGKLEKAEDVDDALKKYRNWIIGIVFIFITALLIPIVNLLVHTFFGGA